MCVQWHSISVRMVGIGGGDGHGGGGDIVWNDGNWCVHGTNNGRIYGINFLIGGYLNGDVGGGIN